MDYQASASSPTPNSALSSTTSTLESTTQGASKISWFASTHAWNSDCVAGIVSNMSC